MMMVTEGIMIALITGGLAIISNIVVAAFQNSKTIYRIDQLEKKSEKSTTSCKERRMSIDKFKTESK